MKCSRLCLQGHVVQLRNHRIEQGRVRIRLEEPSIEEVFATGQASIGVLLFQCSEQPGGRAKVWNVGRLGH